MYTAGIDRDAGETVKALYIPEELATYAGNLPAGSSPSKTLLLLKVLPMSPE